jgi:hypothetical protein
MVKKESLKSRMTAETFYNRIWQIEKEIKECKTMLNMLEREKDNLMRRFK